jgi:hypothetical protein
MIAPTWRSLRAIRQLMVKTRIAHLTLLRRNNVSEVLE